MIELQNSGFSGGTLSFHGVWAISAINYVEAPVVDSARDPVASRRFDELITVAGIDVVAVTAEHTNLARHAYRDFGRGGGSPAQLNFGNRLAYTLAAQRRESLLFKGADFTHTDLVPADLPDWQPTPQSSAKPVSHG
ncbi:MULTISPECIES: type II toxin-antitoxin system VapC family toxin [unclassified Frankia]|uniref:type II toxin-antitoxin system VapC family toxin n=1 Tax=unclassified Frankia TaxID=2632575 RepID=UPI002AD478C0|nr:MULTISPECIES: type II toxin-antitoxin system VapC family toxin [unclassified Frankia]